jgi:pimeloyl-ACP methyl ester carboxylesterase
MTTSATENVIRQHTSRHRWLLFVLYWMAMAVAVAIWSPDASGQSKKKEEDPRLKPRPVSLKTKDGVELRAFYFPSEKGKEAITVLLVHEWQGQASPYAKLVYALREAGCAVLVPDYRGHGGSREYTDRRGMKQRFNLATMSKRDIENIIKLDLEEAKQFLVQENNDGYLNLNALVVIGVREGCVMACHWAARDWRFPSVGSVKQGQDVKALVLISPEKIVKGVTLDSALTDPNLLRLPFLIIGGSGSPEASETERIHKRIEVVKKKMSRGDASGLELKMIDTSLRGAALVKESSEVVPAAVEFVTENVTISETTNPWVERQ